MQILSLMSMCASNTDNIHPLKNHVFITILFQGGFICIPCKEDFSSLATHSSIKFLPSNVFNVRLF